MGSGTVCYGRFPSDLHLFTGRRLREDQGHGIAAALPDARYSLRGRHPRRLPRARREEPAANEPPNPAQYVGIHAKVSEFVARRRQGEVRIDFSTARGAPGLYPAQALRTTMIRLLRQRPGDLRPWRYSTRPCANASWWRRARSSRILRASTTTCGTEREAADGSLTVVRSSAGRPVIQTTVSPRIASVDLRICAAMRRSKCVGGARCASRSMTQPTATNAPSAARVKIAESMVRSVV